MLSALYTKIRALVKDFEKEDSEAWEYTVTNIFEISEDNINSLEDVKLNGSSLGSGEYSYDSSEKEITVSASLTSGDKIQAKYKYYKYSETELKEYIRSAIVWISVLGYDEYDYELKDTYIYPSPDSETKDLIAVVASILIKPNYSEYRLPNLTVRYRGRELSKEDKIAKLVDRFKSSVGVNVIIEF